MSEQQSSSFKSQSSFQSDGNGKKRTRTFINREKYTLRKRHPVKVARRSVDVYATRKTDFKALMERCDKLIFRGEPEIFIHGLGAAIPMACHLALQIKRKYNGSIDIDASTATVPLVNDYIPEDDDVEAESESRNNSAIHIRLYRPDTVADQS